MKSGTICMSFALVLWGAGPMCGQTWDDTMWVDVTFYNFHADGSNPEFNPDQTGGIYPNMVAHALGASRKPSLGTAPFFNHYIAKWFTPFVRGDFTIPVYTDLIGTYGGTRTVAYDTAFKNIVFVDSLPFLHIGNGVYQFERSGQNGTTQFFWLDGKGFGNEPAGYNHNFSFTMELHTQFTYQQGLQFDFLGDDDVWAFVNGNLVMDLGGIHAAASGTVRMDSIGPVLHLVEGTIYPLDFFYAERHTQNSCIKITTNMITRSKNRGPDVTRAVVKPGREATDPDTLVLTFSTPINCQELVGAPPESSLVYIDNKPGPVAVFDNATFLGPCASEYISSAKVLLADHGYSTILIGDSVGFVLGSSHVTDKSGLHPLRSRKVPVEFDEAILLEAMPSPTPASPSQPIDSRIQQAYAPVLGGNTYGTIIGINSKAPLALENGSADSYGKADIYDATGNLVERDLPLKSAGRQGVYGIYWNVKNRNGRIVGNGAYLVIIKAAYTDGRKTQQRVKIAVKR